jgi:organic hydroperoxide reductase OsmC/OhrA
MQYISTVSWERKGTPFTAKEYDRTYEIQFGGGSKLAGSSAPEFLGKAELTNPEELFAAAISSCFMLTFLYWAAMKNITIDAYAAKATATLAKNADGKMAITELVLSPQITFAENIHVDKATLDELFKKAHENCFISNSVKTKISVQMEKTMA